MIKDINLDDVVRDIRVRIVKYFVKVQGEEKEKKVYLL